MIIFVTHKTLVLYDPNTSKNPHKTRNMISINKNSLVRYDSKNNFKTISFCEMLFFNRLFVQIAHPDVDMKVMLMEVLLWDLIVQMDHY